MTDTTTTTTYPAVAHYTVALAPDLNDVTCHATLQAAEAHAEELSRNEYGTPVFVTAIMSDPHADDVTISEFVNGRCLNAWCTEDELGPCNDA